jgi:hypothetical protein
MISHDQCNGLLGLNGTTLPPTGTTTMITKARRSVRQTQSARRRTRPRSSRGRVQSGEGGQARPTKSFRRGWRLHMLLARGLVHATRHRTARLNKAKK